MISVVVTICHLIAGQHGPFTVCFERLAGKIDLDPRACGLLMPGAIGWKEKSKYAGPRYFLKSVECVEGDFSPKDEL